MKDTGTVMHVESIIIATIPENHSPGAKSWKRKHKEERIGREEERRSDALPKLVRYPGRYDVVKLALEGSKLKISVCAEQYGYFYMLK